MIPEILIVYNVKDSLADLGINIYQNRIVQEMGGQYYFIDFDYYDWAQSRGCSVDSVVKPLPLKIAYFLIEYLRVHRKLKALTLMPSNDDLRQPEMAVYLNGEEIPASLRPVVVEEL